MRGTHWGKGTLGLQAAVPKRPYKRPYVFIYCHLTRVSRGSVDVNNEQKLERGVVRKQCGLTSGTVGHFSRGTHKK